MVKTESQRADREKDVSSKRKRPYQQASNVTAREKEVGEANSNRNNDEQTNNKTLMVRTPKRKKRKKNTQRSRASDSKKPLAGMTISVSISSDNTKNKHTNSRDNDDNQTAPNTYKRVCRSCRGLGADVVDLVCKRVDLLLCSDAAVQQSTQRVRKAIKRGKPLVSLNWLEQCRKQGRKIDIEEYRLDENAEDTNKNRQDHLTLVKDKVDGSVDEAIPGAGWSEPKDLGCCCVCHENGTTADCPWCVDCPYR